jgi:membrane protease YdiL (CAAX protease family)
MRGSERVVRKIVWFVVVAYVWSWAWWIPLAMSGVTIDPGQGWPTHLVGLTGPALAALVVTGFSDGRRGLRELWSRIVRWRVGWTWYATVVATAALVAIPLLTMSVVHADDVVRYSGAPSVGVAVVAYVLIVNGFGEEIGWRGFLVERLLRTASRGTTALIVWPIWALWHVPLFWLVSGFRDLGIGGTIGWVVGIGFGSVVLTWLYQSANRSILIVALWHTAYNFATATEAASGVAAAVASAAVIVAGVIIMRRPATWTPTAAAPGRTRVRSANHRSITKP